MLRRVNIELTIWIREKREISTFFHYFSRWNGAVYTELIRYFKHMKDQRCLKNTIQWECVEWTNLEVRVILKYYSLSC